VRAKMHELGSHFCMGTCPWDVRMEHARVWGVPVTQAGVAERTRKYRFRGCTHEALHAHARSVNSVSK
jgi:hypothetical protein